MSNKILDDMRDVMRRWHYSIRTKRSYCEWEEKGGRILNIQNSGFYFIQFALNLLILRYFLVATILNQAGFNVNIEYLRYDPFSFVCQSYIERKIDFHVMFTGNIKLRHNFDVSSLVSLE